MSGTVIRYQTVGPRGGMLSQPREVGTCPATGKRQFRSEDEALSAGIAWAQANSFALSSRSVYHCDCGYWHLTHHRGSRRRHDTRV